MWTAQQQDAIGKVGAWLKAGTPQIFTLYGFAGTGKTTILKHLVDTYNACTAAYTGKATLVLRKKGCHDANTIHSMIYRRRNEDPKLREELERLLHIRNELGYLSVEQDAYMQELQKELARLDFELNEDAFTVSWKNGYREVVTPPDLIAIDEGSMVDERIGEDLLSFNIPVLVVMDPAQLPPIKGEGFFFTATPDVMLTEIHRQAWDSSIIRMATAVRNGAIRFRSFGFDAQVSRKVPSNWYADPELQLICGRHVTRFKYNAEARKGFGFENELPVVGDKLCCFANNRRHGLLNGSFWRVLAVELVPHKPDFLSFDLRSEDNGVTELYDCVAHKRLFLEAKPPENWDQRERSRANEFSYGYALTCHKAQGSEWKKVVLIDESWLWGDRYNHWRGEDRNRWLYTGITRASERLIVVNT